MRWDIIIILTLLALMTWLFFSYSWTFYLFIITIGLILFYIFFLKKYDEFERGIIFRTGKFNRIVGPGWCFVLPFFEKEFARIDARTHMINLELDEAYTSDDLRLNIEGMFYYRIIDPEKALLQIDNYEKGVKTMMNSETRNVIASLGMRDIFANLDKLEEIVLDRIRHDSWKWGVEISMVQLKNIIPPIEIAEAMQEKEISAQQLQAKRFIAEAKKVMISAIGSATENLSDKTIMYLYLEALKELGSGEGSKILFPAQFLSIIDKVGSNLTSKDLSGLDINETIQSIKSKILESKK